jgi:hypothetical protein
MVVTLLLRILTAFYENWNLLALLTRAYGGTLSQQIVSNFNMTLSLMLWSPKFILTFMFSCQVLYAGCFEELVQVSELVMFYSMLVLSFHISC